ncbi:hypothetical protein T11_18261, partial [Trichinella zimbabwensis]
LGAHWAIFAKISKKVVFRTLGAHWAIFAKIS